MPALKPGALPVTEDLEAAFVWCLLREPGAAVRFGDWLRAEVFPTAGRAVAEIAAYLEATGRAPSAVVLVQLVANRVEDGKADPGEVARVAALLDRGDALRDAGALDPEDVLGQMAERLRQHHAGALAVDAVPRLVHGDPKGLEIVAERLDAIRAIGSGALDPGVSMADSDAVLASIAAGDDSQVAHRRSPTGVSALDAVLGGGLGPGDLGVWQGGTGVGKSFALVQAAVAGVRRGRAIVYLTLEVGVGEVYLRLLANLLDDEPLEELRGGLEAESPKVRAAMRERLMGGLAAFCEKFQARLYVKALEEGAPVSEVRAYLDALEKRTGLRPAVVCVDYADLLGAGTAEDGYAAMGRVYRELRKLAGDRAIPIWTASQPQRGAQRKRVVSESDVADSMNKSRKADVLVSICQTVEESQQNEVRLFVAKNRTRPARQMLGPFQTAFSRGRLCDG